MITLGSFGGFFIEIASSYINKIEFFENLACGIALVEKLVKIFLKLEIALGFLLNLCNCFFLMNPLNFKLLLF